MVQNAAIPRTASQNTSQSISRDARLSLDD